MNRHFPNMVHHLKPVTLLRYERMCKQLLGIGKHQEHALSRSATTNASVYSCTARV